MKSNKNRTRRQHARAGATTTTSTIKGHYHEERRGGCCSHPHWRLTTNSWFFHSMKLVLGFSVSMLLCQVRVCDYQELQQQQSLLDSVGVSSTSLLRLSSFWGYSSNDNGRPYRFNYLADDEVAPSQPERNYLSCLWSSLKTRNEIDDNDGVDDGGGDGNCTVLVHAQPKHHPRRIPPLSKSNRTASLCLFIKNEHLYLNEYVDYHLAIGFDEIFIFDNSVNFNLQSWYQNNKYMETQGRINITHFPGMMQQTSAYESCLEYSQQRNHTWMGILDADEMLIFKQDKYTHVIDLLEEYCLSGALSLYWMVFGHSNQTRYRPYPLAQRFRYRTKTPNRLYKTIGKISDIKSVHIHGMELHKPTKQRNILGLNVQRPSHNDDTKRIQSSQVATIHHYWLKSFEEWFIKACWRGRPVHDVAPNNNNNNIRNNNSNSSNNNNTTTNLLPPTTWTRQNANCRFSMAETKTIASDVYDDSAWRALKQFVPEYATLDRK